MAIIMSDDKKTPPIHHPKRIAEVQKFSDIISAAQHDRETQSDKNGSFSEKGLHSVTEATRMALGAQKSSYKRLSVQRRRRFALN